MTEISIDWKKVAEWLESGNNGVEIAARLGIHPDTLYRRTLEKFEIGFADYSAQKRASGDASLKSKQYEKALTGDTSMLIWLGKTRLGQRDIDQMQRPQTINIIASNDLIAGINLSAKTVSDTSNQSPQ